MDRNRVSSMGWERDLPDFRDLTAEALKTAKKGLPPSVDLRKWCSTTQRRPWSLLRFFMH